jgi:hypothetical protein
MTGSSGERFRPRLGFAFIAVRQEDKAPRSHAGCEFAVKGFAPPSPCALDNGPPLASRRRHPAGCSAGSTVCDARVFRTLLVFCFGPVVLVFSAFLGYAPLSLI